MIEESADLVGGFGREDVLELASLLLDFGFAIHGERIGEEALGETVAADDVGGALVASRGELDDGGTVAGGNTSRFQRVMARIDEGFVLVRFRRMRTGCDQSHGRHFLYGDGDGQRAVNFHLSDFGQLSVLFERK